MKKINKILAFIIPSVIAIPALAVSTTFKELINNVIINGILKSVVSLLISLAVVVFIYGVLTTMLSEGGEKKEDGKQYMLWGIIGIFVMVSMWGIVAVLQSTFNLSPAIPSIRIGP